MTESRTKGIALGFISLGNMGLPRAIDLLKAEYELRVHNRTAQKTAPLAAAGAKLDRSGCDSDAAAPGCG